MVAGKVLIGERRTYPDVARRICRKSEGALVSGMVERLPTSAGEFASQFLELERELANRGQMRVRG